MDIAEAIRIFADSKIESERQLNKVGQSELIIHFLKQLRAKAGELATNIDCECAVIEAQNIINS